MEAGNMIGNVLGLLLIVACGLVGFVSLEASAIAFIAVAYGLWLLTMAMNYSNGRAISDEFKRRLLSHEVKAFQQYGIHVRAPGAGAIFSALLNLLRLAGFVWAGLLAWQQMYVFAGLCAAFFFVSGNIILKTDPIRYMGKQASNGHEFALGELRALESVRAKREAYFSQQPT